jgi:WD40 repeat protein
MSSTVLPTFLGDASSLILHSYGLRPFHTDGDLLTLGFAPDGTLWSVEEPGVLRNWDLYAQKQTDWHALEELATTWCFNNTTRLVAAGSDEIAIWVGPTGEQLASWPAPSWTTALGFSPNSQILVSGHDDGIVRVWDWHTAKTLHLLSGHEMPISAVAFSRDGFKIATAGEDRLIRIWDAHTGQLLATLEGHTDRIPALAWHPDGNRLVSAGWDTTARVWNVNTGEPIILLNSHSSQVFALAFSPEGRLLACADSASNVHVWDFDNYRTLRVLRDQVRECSCIAFSLDGQILAAGGADHLIAVWDARRDLHLDLAEELHLSRTCLAVSPDGRRLHSIGTSTPLRIWDVQTGDSVAQLKDTGTLRAFALSPDGQWIAASLATNEDEDCSPLALYRAATGQRHALLEGPTDPVTTLAFAPDGRQLATASFQGPDVWLWSIPQGEPMLLLNGIVDACCIDTVAYDPTGRLLAITGIDYMSTSGQDGMVILWDLGERKEAARLRGGATRAVFHPSGRYLAVASLIQTIRIWDLQTHKLIHELMGHLEGVASLAYSPDGRWLASGGDDRTLRLWDAAMGEQVQAVELDSQVKALVFSPDSRFLYTGNANTSCYKLDLKQLLGGE